MLILFYILMNSFSVNGLYLPSKGFSAANDTAEEIQHAICRISSKELQASANATLTRQLKGVCTSSYIQERLDEMQNKVLHQIEGIKSILESNGFVIPQSTESLEKQTVLIEKSLDHTEYSIADEISTFNDTVANSNKGSIYYYYWDIHQIRKLLGKKDMYKSSPEFFVLGHTLHLQFYPNHLEENFFGILLRPSSNGFLKKHKIIILNQLRQNSDISSDILNGIRSDDSTFIISEDSVNGKGFIYNDTMIVKLELFLNS
nr:uncharacterized protein LOC111509976 isoform X2 [Leptinotarsa decemlineata]